MSCMVIQHAFERSSWNWLSLACALPSDACGLSPSAPAIMDGDFVPRLDCHGPVRRERALVRYHACSALVLDSKDLASRL